MITNRRDFLMGSLAAGALSSKLRAQDASIRLGFIGTGNRGFYLVKQFFGLEGVQVKALCDIKPDRLDQAASTAAKDDPFTTSEWKKLIRRDDLDAVVVATPCDLHVEMATAALEAGKHVYCEKPIGITPEGVAKLVKVARASDKVFQAGQQMRSMERLQKTIDIVHQGIIGDVIMVKAQRHSSNDLPHDASSNDWFFNAKRSGDVLVEMSVHNLDLCNWVIGDHPARASGFGGTLKWKNDPPGRTNMDGYTLSYDYANGAKLSYTQVFFHPRGMPGGGQYVYAYGTKGAVDVMNSHFYPDPDNSEEARELVPDVDEDSKAHMKAFLATIRGERKSPAGIEIGATGALTAIMGREAIYGKKVVEWSDLGVNL